MLKQIKGKAKSKREKKLGEWNRTDLSSRAKQKVYWRKTKQSSKEVKSYKNKAKTSTETDVNQSKTEWSDWKKKTKETKGEEKTDQPRQTDKKSKEEKRKHK